MVGWGPRMSWLMMMWWLISSAPDFWGRGPGFEFDPDALQDHCVIL